MKKELSIYYDEEADFLEIQLDEARTGYFRDIEEGVSERIDEKTGKVIGIAIMGFKKRAKQDKNHKIFLPLNLLE